MESSRLEVSQWGIAMVYGVSQWGISMAKAGQVLVEGRPNLQGFFGDAISSGSLARPLLQMQALHQPPFCEKIWPTWPIGFRGYATPNSLLATKMGRQALALENNCNIYLTCACLGTANVVCQSLSRHNSAMQTPKKEVRV